jgi:chitinase
MSIRSRLLSLVATVAACAVGAAPPAVSSRGPVIIAYVFAQDDLLDPATIAAEKLTHINYAFADIKGGKVVEGFSHDAENFKVLAGLRKKHPHLRILVSVGGWTWSGAFSDMVLTPKSRAPFVASAVDFVRRHDLDGFDVDWEYPGLPGNGNTHRPEDKANFTALMTELRAGLDSEGKRTSRRYLLTFAAGAFSDFLARTEMDKVQATVDFVNLMTYDFRESSGDPVAGHHANLYPNPSDTKNLSADRAVREFLAAGVPAEKLSNVIDGTSNTVFVGERCTRTTLTRGTFWADSFNLYDLSGAYAQSAPLLADYDACIRIASDQAQCKYGWGSFHSGVINFVYGDGSVRTVRTSIDMVMFTYLSTIAGGEIIQGDN